MCTPEAAGVMSFSRKGSISEVKTSVRCTVSVSAASQRVSTRTSVCVSAAVRLPPQAARAAAAAATIGIRIRFIAFMSVYGFAATLRGR